MPAVRLSRRRRSFAMPVTFAPNVTPYTYADDTDSLSLTPTQPALFPPSASPPPPPARRRVPPHKRRSLGYIPRPPNAFMLFRADFVRQRHVPGTIETNHGSLSKIIGTCWRQLPLDEKRVWEKKAREAKAEHKRLHPDYRFRPVHNKNKDKKPAKERPPTAPEDERRVEEVAQLLLEGKKGAELAAAVRRWDSARGTATSDHSSSRHHIPRRSSSVPLPAANIIALPTVPFLPFSLSLSRPPSPSPPSGSSFGSASSFSRILAGQRRASSAGPWAAPLSARSWQYPPLQQQQQWGALTLPDVDTSLFEPGFFATDGGFGALEQQHALMLDAPPADAAPPYDFGAFFASLPPDAAAGAPASPAGALLGLSPLDAPYAPHAHFAHLPPLDVSWLPAPPAPPAPAHTSPASSAPPASPPPPLAAPAPAHAAGWKDAARAWGAGAAWDAYGAAFEYAGDGGMRAHDAF